MKTVWIFEQIETEDYNTNTKLEVFETEEKAREFWSTKKQQILDSTDTENFILEEDNNSVYIYDEESPCKNSWYYGIHEYKVN